MAWQTITDKKRRGELKKSTANGPQSTANFLEPQGLFSLVAGKKVVNHKQ
jgi:hypothetical protein